METALAYHALKDQLVAGLGTSHALMHVHAGLAIYMGVQLLLRTRRASLYALAVVFWAEVANEFLDRLAAGSWRWPDTLSDVVLTLMWPCAITAVGLYRRRQWKRRAQLRDMVLASSSRWRDAMLQELGGERAVPTRRHSQPEVEGILTLLKA